MALVLRTSWHLSAELDHIQELLKEGQRDTSRFVGGLPADELAALLSLSLGVRLQAGEVIREFRLAQGDDPLGTPREAEESKPALQHSGSRSVLPFIKRDQVPLVAAFLPTYPGLPWETAKRIIRAARSYQEAVWIADADAELAWLLLVSAVETAASAWIKVKHVKLDNVQLMEQLDPNFVAKLRESAGTEGNAVLKAVADRHASTIRARWRFLEFLRTFGPAPMSVRGEGHAIIDWSPDALVESFGKIYDYRSASLHDSEPFPPPICREPQAAVWDKGREAIAYWERPPGNSFSLGGVWQQEDMPMHLFVFEYIARNALLSFWRWAAVQQGLLSA